MQVPQPPAPKTGDYLDLVYLICNAHAMAVTPFLRYAQGREAYRNGWQTLILLLLCTAAEQGSRFMGHYLGLCFNT